MRSRSAALVLTVALITTACTGGGTGPVTDTPGSTRGGVSTSSVPGPSGSAFGGGGERVQGFGDQLLAWYWSAEEYLASCMEEQGFEYVPWVPPITREMAQDANQAGIEVSPGDGDGPVLRLPAARIPPRSSESEMFRRQADESGFGIFFRVGVVEELPESALGSEDPNLAIRTALDEASLEAYGVQLRECRTEAIEAIGPEPDPPGSEGLDDERLFEAAEIVEGLVEADARYQEALAGYRRCMADRGYPVVDLSGAYDLVQGWFDAEIGRAAAAGRPVESSTEAGLAAAFGEARLAELQAEERQVAVARVECATELWEVEWELLVEYEQKVIADNPDVAALLGER